MKRIQSACLLQTLQFQLKEDFDAYKLTLDRKKTKYVIEDEQMQPDGYIVKLKKQYNQYNIGGYLK